VAGRFVPKLDDVFAKIGLDRLQAVGFQKRIERDFLRHHRFALGDGLCPRGIENAKDGLARFLRIARPMNMPAALRHACLERFQQRVETRQREVVDGAALFAQAFEIGIKRGAVRTPGLEMCLDAAERLLEARIAERVMRSLRKFERVLIHRSASPSAGVSLIPASTSAT
jgi:hypothetical protein